MDELDAGAASGGTQTVLNDQLIALRIAWVNEKVRAHAQMGERCLPQNPSPPPPHPQPHHPPAFPVTGPQNAPEVLPFASSAFGALSGALEAQQEAMERDPRLVSVPSAATSAGSASGTGIGVAIAGAAYRLDSERVRFLLAAYCRVRLKKVRLHPGGRRGGGGGGTSLKLVSPPTLADTTGAGSPCASTAPSFTHRHRRHYRQQRPHVKRATRCTTASRAPM
jgi:hypothetical protein